MAVWRLLAPCLPVDTVCEFRPVIAALLPGGGHCSPSTPWSASLAESTSAFHQRELHSLARGARPVRTRSRGSGHLHHPATDNSQPDRPVLPVGPRFPRSYGRRRSSSVSTYRIWARNGPRPRRRLVSRTGRSAYLTGTSKTGATGLEPATSGVTGHFQRHDG